MQHNLRICNEICNCAIVYRESPAARKVICVNAFFFLFKGVGSDLHLRLRLKVQQESQYEDRGGLKCSRCSETAVFHGDVLITDPQTLSSVSPVFTGLVTIKVNHSLF